MSHKTFAFITALAIAGGAVLAACLASGCTASKQAAAGMTYGDMLDACVTGAGCSADAGTTVAACKTKIDACRASVDSQWFGDAGDAGGK